MEGCERHLNTETALASRPKAEKQPVMAYPDWHWVHGPCTIVNMPGAPILKESSCPALSEAA
jgi:hypothetical protein